MKRHHLTLLLLLPLTGTTAPAIQPPTTLPSYLQNAARVSLGGTIKQVDKFERRFWLEGQLRPFITAYSTTYRIGKNEVDLRTFWIHLSVGDKISIKAVKTEDFGLVFANTITLDK